MKEMHLLPSQTFKLSFSVALTKSLISAAVAAFQPTSKIKQKSRGISKSRSVTAQQGLCWKTWEHIWINQIICHPNLVKGNVRCFLLTVRYQGPRLLLSISSFWRHQTNSVSSQCWQLQHPCLSWHLGICPLLAPLSLCRNMVPDSTAWGQSCWEQPSWRTQ